jgi:general stress protein 26
MNRASMSRFPDPEHQVYVSLSGRASLVLDKAKNHELWNPSLHAWFSGGVDDPDLALIKIDVDGAEYWDSPSTVVTHLTGFVKSKLSGGSADVGDHAKVEL